MRPGGRKTDAADVHHVIVRRHGHVYSVDLQGFLDKGVGHNNPILINEDVVNVPRQKPEQVFLLGHVSKPAPRIYRADALLQVEAKNNDMSLPSSMQALLPSQSPQIETETQIVQSRMILDKVVRELHLDWSVKPWRLPVIGAALARYKVGDPGIGVLEPYAWGNEVIRLGLLDVAPGEIGRPITVTAQGKGAFTVTWPDGSTGQGQVEKTVQEPGTGSRLRISDLSAPAGRKFTVMQRRVQWVVQGLAGALDATEVGKRSNLIKTTLRSRDPRQAVAILNAISHAYVGQNIARSAAEASKSLSFVQSQLPKAKKDVSDAQAALNTYQEKKDSVDLTLQTQGLLTQQTDIEAQINELALKADELRANYTRNHPIFQTLLSKKKQLEQQLAAVKKKTAELPETQKEIFDLQRNLDVAQQVYMELLNRAQDLKVMQASSIGNVRIIDTAQAGIFPVSPRRNLILALSLLLGGLAGAGLVLGRHFLKRGIKGAEDIEKTGLPVFATIGFSPEAAKADKHRDRLPILALEHGDDPVVEALRSLRTSLHFGMLDAETNSVMLTSSAPEAGKSFASVNLSVVSAEAGQRVCLIDADMRRGYLRRYFGVPKNTPGLAEYLAGGATLDEVMLPGPVDGLFFIPTGQMPPNPSELLMRKSFTELLQRLNEKVDLILIDAPPTLAVTDPVIMGRQAGATILMTRHMTTTVEEVEAVRKSFENAGARLSGAVLNAYRAGPGQYSRGYYHYNYRYSYTSKDKA